jgi:peptidoglycan hydrolase-like protein with peptidoglycan-binding domain
VSVRAVILDQRFPGRNTQVLIEGDKGMAINGDLIFEEVDGPWKGNDFPNVSMVSVSFNGVLHAFAFLTHMNIDFDGAPNAYGPPGKNTLDSLDHAGQNSHYYGLVAIKPDEGQDVFVPGKGKQKKTFVELYNLKLDPSQPDSRGYLPVVQLGGEFDGYYISITSRATRSLAGANRFQQSSYVNSAKVPFGALSGRLQSKGVAIGNYGMAIRHDNGKQAGFVMMDGGHTSGKDVGAVGEVSYKVFLDLGGLPKTAQQSVPRNEFPTSFIVFRGSAKPTLPLLARADNADDLPMLLAFFEQAGDADRSGKSGKPLLDDWVAKGRTGARPRNYRHVLSALQQAGFWPPIGDFPDRQGLDRIARTA